MGQILRVRQASFRRLRNYPKLLLGFHGVRRAERDVGRNIFVNAVDLVANLLTYQCIFTEEQHTPGSPRSTWTRGVDSPTEVFDLRGLLAAQGVDAVRAGHAQLPVLPGGYGSQAETSSDLHEAELSTSPGRSQ